MSCCNLVKAVLFFSTVSIGSAFGVTWVDFEFTRRSVMRCRF
jgi:hypothetical protein